MTTGHKLLTSCVMKRMLTSCFGLGLLPWCPGTWGSLPPVLLFFLLASLGMPYIWISIVMGIWALAGSIICVSFSPDVINMTGKKDPGEIVIDELAGQSVTFIPVFLLTEINVCLVTAMGFIFFRIFDIAKPFPIKKAEQLPKGWGILADDLLAGVFASVFVFFISFFWNHINSAQNVY